MNANIAGFLRASAERDPDGICLVHGSTRRRADTVAPRRHTRQSGRLAYDGGAPQLRARGGATPDGGGGGERASDAG